MNIKKWFVSLLVILLLFPVLSLSAYAAVGDPEFYYELTVDGKDTVEVNPGDVITVTLHLYRTDSDTAYIMHAMQDEIRYDSNFLEVVENGELLSSGIQSTDIAREVDWREFYMNFVSLAGGATWQPKTRVGSFQLKVIGTSGVTTITNEDYLVSLKDGSGSYKCDANQVTVILTTDCTVKFETNGGTPIDPIQAIYGETIARPKDPVREGKHLEGWYKDIHLTEEWDFETDTVKGNMTLYAKWADGEADGARSCVICGRETNLVPGLALCWLCLLIIILILLILALIIVQMIYNRRKSKKTETHEQ